MKTMPKTGLRIAGLLLMALAIAHCGDSDVRVTTGGGITPGTFVGTTEDGGAIRIVVGSIREIEFDCDGVNIQETFSPPRVINADGTFDVSFSEGGRGFQVEGTFTSNNSVTGTIDDEENECDVSFDATRRDGVPPTRTSTPDVDETPTPAETTTGDGTPAPTATPDGTGGTATTTPSDEETPCPTKLTVEGQGSQADLDTGWTGIAQDQIVINKGTITVALECPGTPGACGDCTVSGPIESTTVVNNQRMASDTSQTCTGAPSGGCAFFFGGPLPLSSGGVPVCVTNRVNGTITGTANPDVGSGSSDSPLISAVFTGIEVDKPCPVCSGSGFNQMGTCDGGARNGMPCTVHGTSELFGNTSFDCPPNAGANIGNLDIALDPTTGSSSLSPSASCTQFPFTGSPCYCTGQQKPNDCTDGVCTADSTGEGTCEAGPVDSNCGPTETFRGCLSNADCTVSGDTCQSRLRKCQGATPNEAGMIEGDITRTGTPNPTAPTLAATFCIAATGSSAVNTAAGLPGPGALLLPTQTCFGDSCSF